MRFPPPLPPHRLVKPNLYLLMSFFSFFFFFTFSDFMKLTADDELLVTVWDWDRFTEDDFLGYFVIQLSDLPLGKKVVDWYALRPKPSKTFTLFHEACLLSLSRNFLLISPLRSPGHPDSQGLHNRRHRRGLERKESLQQGRLFCARF